MGRETELQRCHRLSEHAAKAGYDFHSVEEILVKAMEEIGELVKADSKAEAIGEACDVIFVMVNLMRWLGVEDPEIEFKRTNNKFSKRFNNMVRLAESDGKRLEDLSQKQMQRYWSKGKLSIEIP